MGSELAACPVCGKAVFENHAEVFCEDELCVYMSATVEIHNTLARRAEIGALVEEMCRNGSLDGPLKIFPSRLADGPVRVSLAAFSGVRNGEAATLLEALRALAKEVSGE